MWLAVYYAHHLVSGSIACVRLQAFEMVQAMFVAIVLVSMNVLFGRLVPYSQKDILKSIYLGAFYTAMHVAPFAHLLCAVDVVVCHVHSACIGYLSVDDNYLAVVAMQHVINPWEAYRVEFEYLDATRTNVL